MTAIPPEAYGAPSQPLIVLQTDVEPRCWRCRRMLARYLTRPWRVDCPKCKAVNEYERPGLDPSQNSASVHSH